MPHGNRRTQRFDFLIIGFFIFFFISLRAWFAYKSSEEISLLPSNGTEMVAAELTNLATKKTLNLASLKGKVLLVTLWATWCDACMEELPSIIKLANRFNEDDFQVIAINLDESSYSEVQNKVSHLQLPFQIFRDEQNQISNKFSVVTIPFNILIDKNFRVVFFESGRRNWFSEKTVKKVEGLISDKSP